MLVIWLSKTQPFDKSQFYIKLNIVKNYDRQIIQQIYNLHWTKNKYDRQPPTTTTGLQDLINGLAHTKRAHIINKKHESK